MIYIRKTVFRHNKFLERMFSANIKYMLKTHYAILVILFFVVSGCAGSQSAQKSEVQQSIDNLPSWFTDIPESSDSINGVGSGESVDLQMAISIARNTARARIAEGISVQTGLIQRNFSEQISVNSDGDENTNLDQFFQSINRDIAVETLNGVQTEDQVIQDNERGGYRVYVWLKMPIGEISQAYLERIRENRLAHTRLRATTAFEDLEQRVEEYNSNREPKLDEQ